uniref:Uncharacterized protein n=1 Tax=Arundo donax TaxID=35708 RepID=A0A0A8YYG9_ARUDO
MLSIYVFSSTSCTSASQGAAPLVYSFHHQVQHILICPILIQHEGTINSIILVVI